MCRTQHGKDRIMKIYLYGMICCTNSFKLDAFPKPDEYSEIQQSARFIGGETGTCAAWSGGQDRRHPHRQEHGAAYP